MQTCLFQRIHTPLNVLHRHSVMYYTPLSREQTNQAVAYLALSSLILFIQYVFGLFINSDLKLSFSNKLGTPTY